MIRQLLRMLLRLCYRVEVSGEAHYRAAGERVLMVSNHLSFLDAILLACFLPEKPMFAINTHIAKRWWVRPFLSLVHAFPIDPTNPMATKKIIEEMRKDRKCVIFPEGRITVTGSLMKIYEGPGLIADKSGSVLLPIRLEGAQYSPFSRLRGKVRLRWFPRITLTIEPPVAIDIPEEVKGRSRRAAISLQLYDIMSHMLFDSSPLQATLFEALMDSMAIHGGNHRIAEDIQRSPLTYRQLIARSRILGDRIKREGRDGDRVGIMLPNMVSTLVCFFAVQVAGRVPAMLNFSTGAANIASAIQTAQIGRVYSSRQFVEKGRLQPLVTAMEQAGAEVSYLEDMAATIPLRVKLSGLVLSYCPWLLQRSLPKRCAEDTAVVLFTSGSEGAPKGVALSHRNLLANRYQMAARIDFNATDRVFNALPVFHSFGLTGGTLLPVLSGASVFFYPSPLHYRIVPELAYDTNATILFGTDTFLSGYARFAHPYDFYNVRYIFAGAEKLKEETRRIYSEKYGVRILEGYGATETSPVIACNTPMHHKAGTVGRILPGIETQLEEVPGIAEGGKLKVRGPNVMQGYLLASAPGVLQPVEDGWYDTGDIVTLDAQGFVTIAGRAKRFAKIGGEMVSLTAVEKLAQAVWPGFTHAVIAVPDAKKGEQLVLFSDNPKANRAELQQYGKEKGVSELSIPRQIEVVSAIPVLGTGKVDLVSLKEQYVQKLSG